MGPKEVLTPKIWVLAGLTCYLGGIVKEGLPKKTGLKKQGPIGIGG